MNVMETDYYVKRVTIMMIFLFESPLRGNLRGNTFLHYKSLNEW